MCIQSRSFFDFSSRERERINANKKRFDYFQSYSNKMLLLCSINSIREWLNYNIIKSYYNIKYRMIPQIIVPFWIPYLAHSLKNSSYDDI